jgi:hypothetical protein
MIYLKQLQFTKDKGILVAFSMINPTLDINADMQVTTFDLRGSDRFYRNLAKAKYGIEKIVFGTNQAARRRNGLRLEGSDQFGSVEMSIDTMKFGADDDGDFVVFVMSAGLNNFENVGTMKLPKAYYKKSEASYNLFPVEDQTELIIVKEEVETMIKNYLSRVGDMFSSMFDEDSADGKQAVNAPVISFYPVEMEETC